MNNEIKEILEQLENMFEISELEEQVNDINKVRDYITNLKQINNNLTTSLNKKIEEGINLQQENEYLNNELNNMTDYVKDLQQENEEWTMIFDTFSKRPYAHKYLEEKRKELGNDKIIGLDSEMIYKDYYDYKSRCEKALKILLFDFDTQDTIFKAINILQNGSEKDDK